MKLEYLLIKSNNDFCATEEQFKSLILSNKRLTMDDDQIQFSGENFTYMLTSQVVKWKKRSEIVFYFVISTEDDVNVQKLEDFDKLLHRINDECGNQFIINTIWDDVSMHYTKKLYPMMIEVENLLRKLIYRISLIRFSCPELVHTHHKFLAHACQKSIRGNVLPTFNIRHLIFVTSNPISNSC